MSDQPPVRLEDVLLALQKSISRVSARTRAFVDEKASGADEGVAFLVGNVQWDLDFKGTPTADHLVYDPEGGLRVALRGEIAVPTAVKDGAAGGGDREPA